MLYREHYALAGLLSLAVICTGCGDSRGDEADAGTDVGVDAGTDVGVDAGTDVGVDAGTDVGVDAGTDVGVDAGTDVGVDGGLADPRATVSFAVDDRANATYAAGELVWKGAFAYDVASNVLTPDAAWPGPYVTLYDDGPLQAGGHEAPDATAEDHIWSAAVYVDSASPVTFDYGATDGMDGWIWPGPNGSVTVPMDEEGHVVAPGMTIPAHGTIDFLVSIDTSALHPSFLPFDGSMPVRVKSDAIGWRLVSLPDDGSPPDTTASDGVYWFRMSDAVGAHEGLLHSSDVVAFVFEINSVEYKSGGAPITDGVSAFYDAGAGVQPLSITLNPQNGNTQVTIP